MRRGVVLHSQFKQQQKIVYLPYVNILVTVLVKEGWAWYDSVELINCM